MRERIRAALKVAGVHMGVSLLVACLAGSVVFGIWYPEPLQRSFGGRNLFLILVGVDVICGPLLTMVLYSPKKHSRELIGDLGMVAFLQIVALVYGVWSVHTARPIFLVVEFDRIKVIALPDIEDNALRKLDPSLSVGIWKGPQLVGLREPINKEEKEKIMFESVQGGRDYGERPEFYVKYDAEMAKKSLTKARNLREFLEKNASARLDYDYINFKYKMPIEKLKYLPLMGREDWVAVLDVNGFVIDYLEGDGFK